MKAEFTCTDKDCKWQVSCMANENNEGEFARQIILATEAIFSHLIRNQWHRGKKTHFPDKLKEIKGLPLNKLK